MEGRPCGVDSECRQAAKTIYADGQNKLRAEKRGRELGKKCNEAKLMHSVIESILERNKEVEVELLSKTDRGSGLLKDVDMNHFLQLSPASKLEDSIHARKFKGKSFQRAKLTPVSAG